MTLIIIYIATFWWKGWRYDSWTDNFIWVILASQGSLLT